MVEPSQGGAQAWERLPIYDLASSDDEAANNAAEAAGEIEAERLKLMGEYMDPFTIRGIRGAFGLSRDDIIGDVGAGGTVLAERFRPYGANYIGIDKRLEVACTLNALGRPDIHGIQAAADWLPFRDDSFTIGHSRATMSWLSAESSGDGYQSERHRAIAELARVSQKGFYITDYNWDAADGPESYITLVHQMQEALQGFDAAYGRKLKNDVSQYMDTVVGAGGYTITESSYSLPVDNQPEVKEQMISLTIGSVVAALQAEAAKRRSGGDVFIAKALDARATGLLGQLKLLKKELERPGVLNSIKLPEVVSVAVTLENREIKARDSHPDRLGSVALLRTNREAVVDLSEFPAFKDVTILERGDDTSPLAMSSRELLAIMYSRRLITDEGRLILTDKQGRPLESEPGKPRYVLAECTDPQEARRLAYIIVAANEQGRAQATTRLELQDERGVISVDTLGRTLRAFPGEIDETKPPFMPGTKVAEIGKVASFGGGKYSILVALAGVAQARKLGIDYIALSGVEGRGQSADIFEAVYGLAEDPCRPGFEYEPGPIPGLIFPIKTIGEHPRHAIASVTGKGYQDGIVLRPYYADIRGDFFGRYIKYLRSRNSRLHDQIADICEILKEREP